MLPCFFCSCRTLQRPFDEFSPKNRPLAVLPDFVFRRMAFGQDAGNRFLVACEDAFVFAAVCVKRRGKAVPFVDRAAKNRTQI